MNIKDILNKIMTILNSRMLTNILLVTLITIILVLYHISTYSNAVYVNTGANSDIMQIRQDISDIKFRLR